MPNKSEPDAKAEPDDLPTAAAASIAGAIRRTEAALNGLKESLAGSDGENLSEKAAAAASKLYREGQKMMGDGELFDQAKTELTVAIRRNPLASVGAAFVAGLLLALLTRG